MTDSSGHKPGKITLKQRPITDEGQGQRTKPESTKTGARAHQRTRLQTQQRRAAPSPAQKAPAANARPSERRRTPKPQPSQTYVPKDSPEASETFRMFASCPKGLEQALSDELTQLGLREVRAAAAGCSFRGNWQDVWRANLHSRLATRILVQLAHAKVANEDELRALALSVNWERWLGPEKTLRVDTSAIRSPMQSLQYCNLLVKDSICDRLRDKEGARPSIDTVRPDARVHTFLAHDSATLYLDTSGESLFKRGWRLDKAEAPIRENLAAGLLALSGWHPDQPLLDPFCGSGTILIEAAWIALKIPPGINRPFAFERLRTHDAPAWQDMRRAATESVLTDLPAPIMGCDISPQAIDAARLNMQRAGLKPGTIEWQVGDARSLVPSKPNGMIVTNPPYGERLAIESDLMQSWASGLKQHFAGWQVNVISADHSLPGAMRLKPKRRVPLYNGALDCRLFIFEMVSAQYGRKDN
ncbi:MAG: THUMP domain-containing protein [Burkholderiaceae bacterium]|nr:THUMP domain-containing protein [Burkholderiaceae bacterium]MCD8517603.1 THUMP domain-containing protein [Burkholderiaceae bacterium]MCD8537397.1 THUMP domain-containing protein [Burkholderiaceae bacterium]MCD8565555.1 THUMP domain-containing protein [Burkholderiaceae bacterium]